MPTFEESLQMVLKEITLSAQDRQSYNEDAVEIRNFIMNEMKKGNPEFREAFDGLSLTGSYLDNLKIDLPDEFDMDMKLKFPFSLKPLQDPNRPDFIILKTQARNRFVGRKGKLCRTPIQIWLRQLFLKTIDTGLHHTVNGRRYLITYPRCGRGTGVAHTIFAKEQGGTKREISFDFVPAFEFPSDAWPFGKPLSDRPWFAIPFGKAVRGVKDKSHRYTFKVSAPHWEREALHDKQNLKNSLRLMKALRDANGLTDLSSYTMKSVYLEEINNHPLQYWDKPMGEILIEMLECLLVCLMDGKLPFFLHKGFNQLNLMKKKQITKYQTAIDDILCKLKRYRDYDEIDFHQVKSMFVR